VTAQGNLPLNRRTWLRSGAVAAITLLCHPRRSLAFFDPRPPAAPQYTFTDAQEIALGHRFAAALEAESSMLANTLIDQHLNQVVQQLAAVSLRPNLPYRVKVLNLSSINAVSLPGGSIYIHRGMLEVLATEDELAAVLSHEIGHIVARHALRQLSLTLQTQDLLKPLLDNLGRQNSASILQQFGGTVSLLARLSFSRHDELEADRLGFQNTLRAGWDPRGFLKMFAALEAAEAAASGVDQPILATHPPTPYRAVAIQHELASVTIPEDARTDSFEFRACKQALVLLGSHPVIPPG
jgi:predicted Zn-dependent protease